MNEWLTCSVTYDGKVNFALQQNHVPVIKSLAITNKSDQDFNDVYLSIVSNPDFSEKWTYHISSLPANDTVELNAIDLTVSTNFLASLDEQIAGYLKVELTHEEKCLYSNTFPIDILSYDEWPGITILPEILASFVTPNRRFVATVLKEASQLLEEKTGDGALDGYQCERPERVIAQLSAVYSVLQAKRISYSNPPASFEREGQKVRFPDTIVEQALGTCLDLTLLFAACAEAIGINPVVVFGRGHAFPAFWLVDYCSAESILDDPSMITKRVAKGVNEMIAIEATCLTQDNVSFTDAKKNALRRLDQGDFFECFIDIRRCRISQIKPLPARHEVKKELEQSSEPGVQKGLTFDYEEFPLESHDLPEKEQKRQENTKILTWQRRLLDLSLRNSLLNYKSMRQGIPFLAPEIEQLEDALAKGEQLTILPKPAELSETVRDFTMYQRQHGNEYLFELVKNDFANQRLRSMLTEAELSKKVTTLYRKAKRAMEENGANTLFIALGFLKWYEDPESEVSRYAPILLLPIEMVRKSVRAGYYIRSRDEEVQINISLIEMLKQRFSINATYLYDIPKDEYGADVQKVFTLLRRLIMDMKRWDIVETASIGLFSFAKFVMWNDLVHRSEDLRKNDVVNSMIENKRTWEIKDSMRVKLSTGNEHAKPAFAPLSADSSQMEAILSASSGNSFVLHGPPGTGKSQTITNIIANVLAEGKTVLFVADKMAALSVVQNRLKQLGLDPFSLELHSNKTNKRDVFAQFEAVTNLQRKASRIDWQKKLEELTAVKQELDGYVKALHQERSLGLSIYEMIERYSQLSEEAHPILLDETQVMEASKATFHEYLKAVKQLGIASVNLPNLASSPWTQINSQTFSFKLRDDVLAVSRQVIDHYGKTKQLLEHVVNQLGIHSELQTKAWVMASKQLLSLFDQRPGGSVRLLALNDFDEMVQQIRRLIEIGKERDRHREEMEKLFEPSVLELNVRELLRDTRVINNSWFVKKYFGRLHIAKQLAGFVKSGQSLKKEQLEQEIERMQNIKDLQSKLDEEKDLMGTYFGRFWDKGNWADLQYSLEWMTKARDYLEQVAATGNRDFQTMIECFVEAIADQNKQLHTQEVIIALEQMIQAEQDLQDLLLTDSVDENKPFWLNNLYDRATDYVSSIDSLKEGCHFASVKQVVLQQQLEKVLITCVKGEVHPNKLLEGFEYSFLRLRIDGEIRNDRTLSAFHSVAWKEKIASFRQLDTLLTEVTKEEIFGRLAAKVPNFQEDNIRSSEPGILQRAIRSNGRGISIRQLFEKIPNLLKRLKPCMLMSPISVAQYLDPGYPLFDVVIFDEASQLPTCEAIGAMARGKHVIVVGDPKQLPPTSFFQSGQEEEDDFFLQDLESVLDDCLALDMPQKHLRWHYRSEHESLISFSNHHYYEDKLVTFPSVDSSMSRVSFRKINGIYEKGKGRHNVLEAVAVVDEVMRRLREHSGESIGVVTFNQAQQTLIEDLIEERLKDEPELECYFNQETPDPVFVKNLENVQGDERDVILFSIGYGPDRNGQVSMNFGPLNREGGWRRLNVAVSRAKREMVIFSSMEPEQIDLSRTKAAGAIGLRAFMTYAKSGGLPTNSFQSAFGGALIDQVAEALRKVGYEVETHVGDSSYKVDIAIRHPDRAETYIAAVQVDGINFVGAQTTRDREKLREGMLEKLGWKIIRVSSLDWWYDREKEVARVVKEVSQAPEKISRESERKVDEVIKLEHFEHSKIAGQSVVRSPNKSYEAVELENVELPSEYFYYIESTKRIREQIHRVIVKEAPISLPQLTRKIASAWGFSRSGSKIEDVVWRNVLAKQLPTSKSGETTFVWRDEEQKSTYQTYRPGKVESRQINDICHQEVGNAMTALMRQSLSLPKDDLIRETAKLFGFSRLGTNVTARLEFTVDYLKGIGVLEETKDRFIRLK